MIQHITADGLALAVPGIVPKLSAAPTLGQHTAQVLDALRDRLAGKPGVWGLAA